MTKKQVRKLKFGVYRVWWKSGGNSVASIGFFADGTRWFSPSNWINKDKANLEEWSIKIRKMTFLNK